MCSIVLSVPVPPQVTESTLDSLLARADRCIHKRSYNWEEFEEGDKRSPDA